MKITKLTITEKELNESVQDWLLKRGLKLIVETVEKSYSGGGDKYEIGIEIPDERIPIAPPPQIQSVEQLGAAIEKGEL